MINEKFSLLIRILNDFFYSKNRHMNLFQFLNIHDNFLFNILKKIKCITFLIY